MSKLVIGVVLILSFGIGKMATTYKKIKLEHKEARNVKISNINFKTLKDGIYHGVYDGGMYKWRENKVEVYIDSGEVKKILLLESTEFGNEEKIFKRIIKNQSLQVDAVAGATLTSKGYLKAVEDALLKAKE